LLVICRNDLLIELFDNHIRTLIFLSLVDSLMLISVCSDDQIIFQKFVGEVNSGINFNNKKGMVDAIPIIAYHTIDNSKDPSSTDVNLFAAEMKYLHDNNFRVIPMSDLGYDANTNTMYIKQ